jgi:hypothetical protein
MKQYNKSLDFITLAMATARKGNMKLAARLFASAVKEPDAKRAIGILEASNKQAYQAITAARKPVVAAEDDMDYGDESDIEDLVGDGGEEEEEGEQMEVESAEEEDDEEDDFDDEAFASVLASMVQVKAKPAAKKRK